MLQINSLDVSLPQPVLGKKDIISIFDNNETGAATIYVEPFETAERLEEVIEAITYYDEIFGSKI